MSKAVIQYYKSTDKKFSIVCGHGVSKRFPMHRHLSLSIGLIVEGFRLLMIDKKKYVIGKGDIFVINPEEPHAVGENNSPEHDYLVISVSKSALDQYFGENKPRFKNIIEDTEISTLLKNWFEFLIMGNNRSGQTFHIEVLLEKISNFQVKAPEAISENPAVEKIRLILDNDPVNNYSLESLANKAFLSPYHFSRIFKKHTGLAPHQYLIDNRLRQARDLLESNFSVIDIAIACGFYDASHFIRHFQGYYGVSPQEYQRGVQQLKV